MLPRAEWAPRPLPVPALTLVARSQAGDPAPLVPPAPLACHAPPPHPTPPHRPPHPPRRTHQSARPRHRLWGERSRRGHAQRGRRRWWAGIGAGAGGGGQGGRVRVCSRVLPEPGGRGESVRAATRVCGCVRCVLSVCKISYPAARPPVRPAPMCIANFKY
jgi:hypothetical protein